MPATAVQTGQAIDEIARASSDLAGGAERQVSAISSTQELAARAIELDQLVGRFTLAAS
jgi:hypothetical protein